jgi:outer membrane protein OmpA-like peptidoglycan-associated protein
MHNIKFLFSGLLAFFILAGNVHSLKAQTDKTKQETTPKMPMEVLVTDPQDNPRQGEEIVFEDTLSGDKYSGITNEKGKFEVKLPGGSTYLIKIKGIGQEQKYQVFSLPELQPGRRYGKSRFIIKYQPPKYFTLDNVYFDVNKATLREKSYAELNELLEYMNRRKSVRVEIAGHTDSSGDDEYNQELSRRRAERVKQYLVSKGISSSRIEAKGYGESRPVADNNTKKGKQKNRRTEVHIISE